MSFSLYNKKNITRRLTRLFYSLAALVRKILFCHSKIKFISSRHRVISCIYMAARRCETFLRVLKNISLVRCAHQWNIFFNTRAEISYLQATMWCSIYYINTNEIPNHFTWIVFWSERCGLSWSHSNVFSHVKISSFRAKAQLVYISLVFIK